MTDPTTLTIFLAALMTALATGLGALPLAFARAPSARLIADASAVAGGLMIAATIALYIEGEAAGPWRTLLGLLLGMCIVWGGAKLLNVHGDRAQLIAPAVEGKGSFADASAARRGLLIVGVMTVHSMAEGIGVGVAWSDGAELGAFITLAIAIHNIPEGLAIALVLVPKGVSVLRAVWWSIFSSLPQPLLAVPAFMFVSVFEPFLPVGLGIAAGAMLWMVLAELVPEALEEISGYRLASLMTLSITAMLAVQFLLR